MQQIVCSNVLTGEFTPLSGSLQSALAAAPGQGWSAARRQWGRRLVRPSRPGQIAPDHPPPPQPQPPPAPPWGLRTAVDCNGHGEQGFVITVLHPGHVLGAATNKRVGGPRNTHLKPPDGRVLQVRLRYQHHTRHARRHTVYGTTGRSPVYWVRPAARLGATCLAASPAARPAATRRPRYSWPLAGESGRGGRAAWGHSSCECGGRRDTQGGRNVYLGPSCISCVCSC